MKKQSQPKQPTPANVAAPKLGQDVAAEVLTAIRQHEPEEQNKIVEVVLRELAIDRINRLRSTSEEQNRSSANLNIFMRLGEVPAITVKEAENTKAGY